MQGFLNKMKVNTQDLQISITYTYGISKSNYLYHKISHAYKSDKVGGFQFGIHRTNTDKCVISVITDSAFERVFFFNTSLLGQTMEATG
jgi:hypothetical protein